MVGVPAGEFIMGSPDGEGADDEHPQHAVTLDAFWIDHTEVTNAQFEQFVQATGHRTDAETWDGGWVCDSSGSCGQVEGADWRHPEGPASDIRERTQHPVVQVSWNDARAYCDWAGARLPTEAEWEKAARGTDGRRYPWGNQDATCEYAVMNDGTGNSCGQGDKAWPVGSKPAGASPYGALDMAGNVWEWVADWYAADTYAHSPQQNPTGPGTGDGRGARGGSWTHDLDFARSAYRGGWGNPDARLYIYGFRCAVATSSP
jgi:formylglycine-generating enzyme required for sulfatase activity